MPQGGYEGDVRILGIHGEAPDGMRVGKADKLPGLTGINGFINSVTANNVSANARFSGSHINHIRVRLGNRDCPDRR